MLTDGCTNLFKPCSTYKISSSYLIFYHVLNDCREVISQRKQFNAQFAYKTQDEVSGNGIKISTNSFKKKPTENVYKSLQSFLTKSTKL